MKKQVAPTHRFTTTCQLCGRAIKSKNGRIAHHGYKRPWQQGWQTSSCSGAREKSYEVSCEILPEVIKSMQAYKAEQEKSLAEWRANPPRGITEWPEPRRYSHQRERFAQSYLRPADFNPETSRGAYMPGRDDYAQRYHGAIYGYESRIKGVTMSIASLEHRLADWPDYVVRTVKEFRKKAETTEDWAFICLMEKAYVDKMGEQLPKPKRKRA